MTEVVGSKSPQAAALFAYRIDEKRRHKQADGNTDGNLDHLRSNVEAYGVGAVRAILFVVNNVQITILLLRKKLTESISPPRMREEAVCRAVVIAPLAAREPGTWT